MKRIVILGAMALTLSLAVPMTVQAEENGTDMVLAAKSVAGEFKTALQEAAHKTIKFANQDGINIYKEPSTGAVVLDQAFLNTSFEVLGEYGDWSMITTEAGHAYIETKYLSGIEIRRPSYSEEDLYILAHVICGEAQNCPDDEQLLVGSVVLNRVNHGRFPNTIKAWYLHQGSTPAPETEIITASPQQAIGPMQSGFWKMGASCRAMWSGSQEADRAGENI